MGTKKRNNIEDILITTVDVDLLNKQRLVLADVTTKVSLSSDFDAKECAALDGILAMLDAWSDARGDFENTYDSDPSSITLTNYYKTAKGLPVYIHDVRRDGTFGVRGCIFQIHSGADPKSDGCTWVDWGNFSLLSDGKRGRDDLTEITEGEYAGLTCEDPSIITEYNHYRTEDGRPVIIHDAKGKGTFCVKGSIYRPKKGLHNNPEYCIWTERGAYAVIELEENKRFNLVEITAEEHAQLLGEVITPAGAF